MVNICNFVLCRRYHNIVERNPEKEFTWESIWQTILKIGELSKTDLEELPDSKKFADFELNNLVMNVLGTYHSLLLYDIEKATSLFSEDALEATPKDLCMYGIIFLEKIQVYSEFIKEIGNKSGIDRVPLNEREKYRVVIKQTIETGPSTRDANSIRIICSNEISYDKTRFEQDIARAKEEIKTLKIEKAKQENKGKGKKQQQSNSTKQANKERDRKKKEREEFYKRSGMACAKK